MSEIRLSSIVAPVYYPLIRDVFNHGHTNYDLSGGRGSLKSSTVSIIIPTLIVKTPGIDALVVRKVANTLRDSVFAQYIWAIDKLGMSAYWTAKVSPMELIYRPTGQKIMFRGADDPMKLKSIKSPSGYFAITHFEEKDQFAGRAEIRNILQSTQRGGEVFWNFESYNPPISRDNWANIDSLEDRPDRLTLKTTYLDAPREWLGEQFVSEAEYIKATNERAYRHEYLGEATGTGGNVFENIVERTITDEEIKSFDRVYNGVDWGFFPDPWAFNRVYYRPATRSLVIFDEDRRLKLNNRQTADILIKEHGITEADWLAPDSAEKKSVADYRSYGLSCLDVVKGPGSVEQSTKWLQGLSEIVIDRRRTPHTHREFTRYEYERTKDGQFISGYPDKDNHNIDAVRYAVEQIWRRRGA